MLASSCLDRPARLRGRLMLLLVMMIAVTGLSAAAAEEADAAREGVKAMSRNLYLGADLTPLILAPTRQEFRQRATAVWQQVKRTDFPKRSGLLATEVKQRKPDLIGLQEVALWRRGERGQADGEATPARNVRFNFLSTLKRELRQRGQSYKTVVVQKEADIEGRTSRNFDVRLTMRDVILVRRGEGLNLEESRGRNFANNLVVPTAYGPVESTRGWTAVDVRLRGRLFRFVNTHLEAFSAAVRADQARELTRRDGALQTGRQTILVGDLNSDPNGNAADAAAYEIIRAFGFADAWLRTRGNNPGLTCCFNAEVNDRRPDFSSRIDHVLIRNGVSARTAWRIGTDQDNRTRSGLWPSDHAGVVASLRVRVPNR